MRQCYAERSRPAGGWLAHGEQLIPYPANAVVGRFVNVDMAVLVETEQRRLRVIADSLKDLIDRGETIGEPVTIRKMGMAQQIGDVERMQRRRSAAGGRLARQFEKNLREQEIVLDQLEHLRRLLGRAGRKRSGMDLRLVVIEPA